MTPAAIVSKLWNYCNVLRDDGMNYGDYVDQLRGYVVRSLMLDFAHRQLISLQSRKNLLQSGII